MFCLVFLSCPTSFSWLPYSQLEEFSFHLQNRQLNYEFCGVVGHWRIDHQSGALSQRNNVEKISTNVDYIINIINRKQSLKKVSSNTKIFLRHTLTKKISLTFFDFFIFIHFHYMKMHRL
jgi:hypothetical protein